MLKRSLVVAALIGATCVSTQSLAETAAAPAVAVPQPPPMTVEKLDNGLTVVLVPFPSPGIVAYFTLVEAGARDEVEAGRSGYAHLFEHLMFRGTDTVSAEAGTASRAAVVISRSDAPINSFSRASSGGASESRKLAVSQSKLSPNVASSECSV